VAPHMLLSSRRHFRKAALEGPRPSRAWVGLSEERGEGDAARYLVQVINEPHQIIALKVWHTLLILLPIKYSGEFIAKRG